ncbi:MAG: ABC transporter permease [Eubacterium sp.]|nr:ABC transporter permease [Eubacterium sp.]
MKQFGKILKFELKGYLKNKVFLGVTIFLVAAIICVLFFPRISEGFGSDETINTDNLPVMLVHCDKTENEPVITEAFISAFADYKVVVTDESEQEIKQKIIDENAKCAFVIESLTEYIYYVNDLALYDANTDIADGILKSAYQMSAMLENGIPADDANQILNFQIEHTSVTLGKDQMQNFFYAYIMIFALYMVILIYGQMVATNVASEKSSRAMELLITSVNPTSMIFGKVVSSCLAGLIQLVSVFGTAFICYNINKSYLSDFDIVASIFSIPAHILIYMLVFFLLGFFLYAFLYGAIGSTASKLEDINTSVMPVTFLFIIAFMVDVFSLTSGSVDSALMKICSYIPFTSPVVMFTRIVMSSVSIYEIAISIVILIASVIGVGFVSAKIYRAGVLLYGAAPKLSAIIRTIKKS